MPNRVLVVIEELRKYDEVMLFTQRNKFLCAGQISRAIDMAENESKYITTESIMSALHHQGIKNVRVSTSLDELLEPV